jgi:tripartite-type tricarboxylate transporter receptor subunit TctC
MNRSRIRFAASLLALAASSSLLPVSAQQPLQYPKGTVRIVVPYPAGGATDAVGRLIAQRLGEIWKTTVIVENRVGASGVIGASHVSQAAPDGLTLLLAAGATNGAAEVLNPKTTPYRTLRDFSAIGMVGVAPTIMIIGAGVPAKNVKEFVALALANPGKYNYGNASAGSAPSFAFELLKQITGADIVQIPFNGASPALVALGGGIISAYMGGAFSVLPSIQSGRAKAVGAASSQRTEAFPDLPTLTEQGFPVVWDTWYGLLAPAGVPEPILDKLNADLNKALDGEDARGQLAKQGIERRLGTRKQLLENMQREISEATRVGRLAKMIQD